MTTKVMLVAGARPNYMKIAPIWWAMHEDGAERFEPVLVHTGQHYDDSMSGAFFRDLGLPEPAINLGVGSGSHAVQTAKVMAGFEQVLLAERPRAVVVVGDVNSTAACALVTAKIDLGDNGRPVRPLLAHVEAGLRSRDRDMPEEVNRVVADALSDLLFTTCRDAADNLLGEGLAHDRIHFVGNPMIDSLRRSLAGADACPDRGVRARRAHRVAGAARARRAGARSGRDRAPVVPGDAAGDASRLVRAHGLRGHPGGDHGARDTVRHAA